MNDMGNVAISIQQEIKSKYSLTYRQVYEQEA